MPRRTLPIIYTYEMTSDFENALAAPILLFIPMLNPIEFFARRIADIA